MSSRVCPIKGCSVLIQNKMLLCQHHWGMCPKRLRDNVWATYNNNQENRPELVTTQYLDAAKTAIKAVEDKEAREDQAGRQAQLL